MIFVYSLRQFYAGIKLVAQLAFELLFTSRNFLLALLIRSFHKFLYLSVKVSTQSIGLRGSKTTAMKLVLPEVRPLGSVLVFSVKLVFFGVLGSA